MLGSVNPNLNRQNSIIIHLSIVISHFLTLVILVLIVNELLKI